MLSYANPLVMRILHIADMISGSYVCVCAHPHRNVSLIRVKYSPESEKNEGSRTHQATREIKNDKEMCVKRFFKNCHREKKEHTDNEGFGDSQVCELLIVLWGQLLPPVCTDIDILHKAELCGVLARPLLCCCRPSIFYCELDWDLFLQT